jgi:hypothetical protein
VVDDVLHPFHRGDLDGFHRVVVATVENGGGANETGGHVKEAGGDRDLETEPGVGHPGFLIHERRGGPSTGPKSMFQPSL